MYSYPYPWVFPEIFEAKSNVFWEIDFTAKNTFTKETYKTSSYVCVALNFGFAATLELHFTIVKTLKGKKFEERILSKNFNGDKKTALLNEEI